jgi:hypothetical protein
MSAGAPGTESKNTLCATLPKANVTEPPGTMFAGEGLKAMSGVAATVTAMAGGPDAEDDPVEEALPQAARSARQVEAKTRRIM